LSDPASARLVYRRATASDVPVLRAHYGRPEVRRFLWDDVAPDDETLLAVMSGCLALWTLRSIDEPDRVIGSVGLRERAEGVEILYSLDGDRWGQGLASEAARAVVEHAFAAMELPRVHAGVDAGNERSTAVLRLLGFTPAGEGLWAIER
jgi:RimJ/RimL family protein N-acetyltransferase